jgi:DNA polymerase-1
MQGHLILVDGNNLGFAGMGATKLHAGNADTQATFTVIKQVRRLFFDNSEALIMVLWDGRSWRKETYKDYKANRETTVKQVEDRKAYYKQKDSLIDGLNYLGVTQCAANNMEADDLAEIYSSQWQGDKITLYSGDKDWLQLVDERTTWYDPIRERQCNSFNFQAFTGCKDIKQFLERKYLLGDTGDNIKGATGIGEQTLNKLHSMWDTLDDFHHDIDREEKWKAAFGRAIPKPLEDYSEVMRACKENEVLMNLKTTARPIPINMVKRRQNLDAESFRAFCYENAFLSLLRDYDKFLKPFKENKYVRIGQTSTVA